MCCARRPVHQMLPTPARDVRLGRVVCAQSPVTQTARQSALALNACRLRTENTDFERRWAKVMEDGCGGARRIAARSSIPAGVCPVGDRWRLAPTIRAHETGHRGQDGVIRGYQHRRPVTRDWSWPARHRTHRGRPSPLRPSARLWFDGRRTTRCGWSVI
jgi:hypothetical protein